MRRKSLKIDIVTLDELTACITNLKNEFADFNTQIEVFESDGRYYVEIWKL